MGWGIGFDEHWQRDIGYGVPAECDHPRCHGEIDRGLSYVCGGAPYGGEYGCGLYFCPAHLFIRQPRGSDNWVWNCPRCLAHKPPYKKFKADTPVWIKHKLTHPSWSEWREENPSEVKKLQAI